MSVNKIAVLGAGTMGTGIVWAFASAGKEVIVYDIFPEVVDRCIANVKKRRGPAGRKGQGSGRDGG